MPTTTLSNDSYTVAKLSTVHAPEVVTLAGGNEITATVDALQVLLQPTTLGAGTLTLLYTDPADIAAAQAALTLNRAVTVTITDP